MNKFRVYYEDTDSGGVVYHSNYLNFMERARTEWLRDLGVNQHHLKIEDNVTIAAKSGVTKNIKKNSIIAGFPAVDIKIWKKNIINQYRKIK